MRRLFQERGESCKYMAAVGSGLIREKKMWQGHMDVLQWAGVRMGVWEWGRCCRMRGEWWVNARTESHGSESQGAWVCGYVGFYMILESDVCCCTFMCSERCDLTERWQRNQNQEIASGYALWCHRRKNSFDGFGFSTILSKRLCDHPTLVKKLDIANLRTSSWMTMSRRTDQVELAFVGELQVATSPGYRVTRPTRRTR